MVTQNWFLEDIPLNEARTTRAYTVPEAELVAYASRWDPLPIHVDREAAKASAHKGLIAPATYSLSVVTALINELEPRLEVIGGADWKVRFATPVRPGDTITVTCQCVDKRDSRTKADRGIARFVSTARNQRGESVLIWESNVLISKRRCVPARAHQQGQTPASP